MSVATTSPVGCLGLAVRVGFASRFEEQPAGSGAIAPVGNSGTPALQRPGYAVANRGVCGVVSAVPASCAASRTRLTLRASAARARCGRFPRTLANVPRGSGSACSSCITRADAWCMPERSSCVALCSMMPTSRSVGLSGRKAPSIHSYNAVSPASISRLWWASAFDRKSVSDSVQRFSHNHWLVRRWRIVASSSVSSSVRPVAAASATMARSTSLRSPSLPVNRSSGNTSDSSMAAAASSSEIGTRRRKPSFRSSSSRNHSVAASLTAASTRARVSMLAGDRWRTPRHRRTSDAPT